MWTYSKLILRTQLKYHLWNTTLFGELAVADGVRNVAVNWNRPTLSLFATKALIAKVMLFDESQAAYGNAQKNCENWFSNRKGWRLCGLVGLLS